VCKIMAQSKVVWSILGQFPIFSTENPRFDTTLPWGHHASNSKITKSMPNKVSLHKVHKCAKSWPNPRWLGQNFTSSPSFPLKTLVLTHPSNMGSPWCAITRSTCFPNHAPILGAMLFLWSVSPILHRKPLFKLK
jgi:hypothetical protein